MATYKTKKGLGGLLKEGLTCEIVKKDFPSKGKVLIQIIEGEKDRNAQYQGNFNDLEEV